MHTFHFRALQPGEWREVAELIHLSTNAWYIASGKSAIFTGDPAACEIFCQVYEALDPGCCWVAVHPETQRIVGSCFYHPRPTHISVGIVNTHPSYAGKGLARALVGRVLEQAMAEGKPVRLVSSAMNLDSFSLYTRAGFVPRTAFQDMYLPQAPSVAPSPHVRPAVLADAPRLAALERELVGIDREKDFRYFLENAAGIWSASVWESETGELEGFLVSVAHAASNMLGPGVSRQAEVAAALIAAERRKHPGIPVFLVPVAEAELVATLYSWGAKNCELHFAQVHGAWQAPTGIVMPTFLPETG